MSTELVKFFPQSTELAPYDPRGVSRTPLSQDEITIIWEFWRTNQQRSYHGKAAVVDVLSAGDLALVDVDYGPLLKQLVDG